MPNKNFNNNNSLEIAQEFKKNLHKSSVQVKKQNLHQQINQILSNKKPRFASVREAVEEMKERSGLNNYLKLSKIAQISQKPKIIQEVPEIAQTLQNYITSTRGKLPLPAIIEKIYNLYKNKISNHQFWEEPALLQYISQLNLKAKAENPNLENNSNLGKIDLSDNDADFNNDLFSNLHGRRF